MNTSASFNANFSIPGRTPATRVPLGLAIYVVVFSAVSILMAVPGNAGVCVLFLRRRNLRKVPHYLLGSLALTGLLSALFNMPSLIVMSIANYFQIHDLPLAAEVLCRAKLPLGFALNALNAVTLSLMAFDRQDCVLRPFSRRLTTKNVKKIIPATWIAALIIAVVFIILSRDVPSPCVSIYAYNGLSEFSGVLHATMGAVGQTDTIAIAVVMVTFIRILKELRSSPVQNSAHQRQERKLTDLTFKICGVFVLLRIPVMISHLVLKIAGFSESPATRAATLVTLTIVPFLYAVNPVLHHKMLNFQPQVPVQAGAVARQAREQIVLADRLARENPNHVQLPSQTDTTIAVQAREQIELKDSALRENPNDVQLPNQADAFDVQACEQIELTDRILRENPNDVQLPGQTDTAAVQAHEQIELTDRARENENHLQLPSQADAVAVQAHEQIEPEDTKF